MLKYRKNIIHYSANVEASSLNWIYEVLLIYLITYVPIPILFLLSDPGSTLEYLTKIFFNCFAFIFEIILCYNIFTNNFISITEDVVSQEKENEGGNYGPLNKNEFEAFIKKQKPFLNYNLSITDLALLLGTNRTYLSRFINENYLSSFSVYINKCRLEELEQIRKSSAYATLQEEELIYLVGFKSLNSYKKTLEALDI
ncbi:helix-turn-helix domain-containing protein [Dysgonomonas termitidis]|uniref:HTH araC/xylS-type domain-containing protein n=1 Tax=Dysgonomonas termitidis TaxID=1516126 RepID=A0ABV9L3H9_9BACT